MTDNKRDRIVVAVGGTALGRTPREQPSRRRAPAPTLLPPLTTGTAASPRLRSALAVG